MSFLSVVAFRYFVERGEDLHDCEHFLSWTHATPGRASWQALGIPGPASHLFPWSLLKMTWLQIFFLMLELWRVEVWNLASPKALIRVWVLVSQAIYEKGAWTDCTDAASGFIVPKKLKVLCHRIFYFKMAYVFCLFHSLRDILLSLITDRSRSSDTLTLQVRRQHDPMTMVSPRLGSFYLQLTGESSCVRIIRLSPQRRNFISASPPWALQTYSTLQDFAISMTWVVPRWKLWQGSVEGRGALSDHLPHHRARAKQGVVGLP